MPTLFNQLRRALLALVLIFCLAAPSPASAQTLEPPAVFLPMVTRVGETAAPVNPLHSGRATWYHADGSGSCGFGASPDDLMVAALRGDWWDSAAYCGAFVRVSGPDGDVTVRITDMCPGCGEADFDLDLSAEAFDAIAEPLQGVVPVTWQVVSGEAEGLVGYHFAESSSQWWLSVQVRNHRNPVRKLEFLRDGAWVEVEREAWNQFVISSPDPGPGPYSFRVTDWWGNVLVDEGVPLRAGETVNGAGQFPAAP